MKFPCGNACGISSLQLSDVKNEAVAGGPPFELPQK
jgi:hypothetical protein